MFLTSIHSLNFKNVASLFISSILFLFFSAQNSMAQHHEIKGVVIDTSGMSPIINTSVLLLNEKDSIIVKDTRTKSDGSFTLNLLAPGNYTLLITHSGYLDFVQRNITLPKRDGDNLGKIILVKESVFLKEVLITGRKIPVKIKGDTTEFDATAYKQLPNASVEDLLKKLPGLQVDFYGNITAQGKHVAKVLVDGEEFFGSDPVLVTRNLRSDMIDKVQVYDKKSDRANLTGIEDGIKQKVVNLKLKKDKKNGFFGKVDGNIGTKDYYQADLMLNIFNGDEKFALYGFGNNNGTEGLSKSEINIYSSNEDNVQLESNDLATWNGAYDGRGLPKTIAGGAHYNNKWNEGKQSINGDFKTYNFDVRGISDKDVQQNLPGSFLRTYSKDQFDNSLLRNTANINGNIQLDPSSSLNINIKGGTESKNTSNTFSSQTITEVNLIANKNYRNFVTSSDNKAITTAFNWSKKFRKDRRTITVDFNQYNNDNQSEGVLNSQTILFNSLDSVVNNIRQSKTNKSSTNTLYSKVAYTEPLSKYSSLLLNFGVSGNKAISRKNTYDLLDDMQRGPLDTLLSVDYKINQFTERGGAAYAYNKDKIRLQIGTDFSNVQFSQRDYFTQTEFKRIFTRWNPSVDFAYTFSSFKEISFNYNGNAFLPTINQIAPIVNNIDPLNVIKGNTDLNPYYKHSFSVNFLNFQIANSTFFNVHGDFSSISKPIVNSVQTDSIGRSLYTFENLNGRQDLGYSGGFLYSTKIKWLNLVLGIDGNFSGGKFHNIINKQLNITNAGNFAINLNLSKQKEKKYFVGTSFGPTYNMNNLRIDDQLSKNSSFGYSIKPVVDIYFPWNLIVHSDADYQWRGKTQVFSNVYSRFLWNASLQKGLTKTNNLVARIIVNDILNQNIGFSRSAFGNLNIQDSYNTIRRYFMLSITWNFNKFKKP